MKTGSYAYRDLAYQQQDIDNEHPPLWLSVSNFKCREKETYAQQRPWQRRKTTSMYEK